MEYKNYLQSILSKTDRTLCVRFRRPLIHKGKPYSVLTYDTGCEEHMLSDVDEDGNVYKLPVSLLNEKESQKMISIILEELIINTSRKLLHSKDLTPGEREALLKEIHKLTNAHEATIDYNEN